MCLLLIAGRWLTNESSGEFVDCWVGDSTGASGDNQLAFQDLLADGQLAALGFALAAREYRPAQTEQHHFTQHVGLV